ncbi:Hypothetical predicted protein, partial [Paramuricea clavata]
MFVDDTKCYRPVKDLPDCESLQNDLNNLVNWCTIWKMDLNKPKPPPFWFRYVDDTLTSVDKRQKNDFLDHLNKQNPSLQFTMEREKD